MAAPGAGPRAPPWAHTSGWRSPGADTLGTQPPALAFGADTLTDNVGNEHQKPRSDGEAQASPEQGESSKAGSSRHKSESATWDAPVLALTSLHLPVLGLMRCAPNLLRFDPFSEAFLCFSVLWRHHRAVISAENIWREVLGRVCGAEAKALPTCSQVILATGCQGGF